MFQFTYNSKSASGSKPSANGIPATTPSMTGEEASRPDARLVFLYDLHQARLSLDAAHREFLRRAAPWTRIRLPRVELRSAEPDEPSLQGTSLWRRAAVAAPSLRKKCAMVSKSAPLISLSW